MQPTDREQSTDIVWNKITSVQTICLLVLTPVLCSKHKNNI